MCNFVLLRLSCLLRAGTPSRCPQPSLAPVLWHSSLSTGTLGIMWAGSTSACHAVPSAWTHAGGWRVLSKYLWFGGGQTDGKPAALPRGPGSGQRISGLRSHGAPWGGGGGAALETAQGLARRHPRRGAGLSWTHESSVPPLEAWLKPLTPGGCVLSLSLQRRICHSQRRCSRIQELSSDLGSLALSTRGSLVALGRPVTQPLCVLSHLCVSWYMGCPCPGDLKRGGREGLACDGYRRWLIPAFLF